MGTWNCEGSTKPATNMRVALIIAAAICIAFVAAETTVEQEDGVPETTLTQNEESFGAVRRHIKRIRFSYCRWKAKKCHKHVAKKTAHLKKAAHAHARAGKHAAKVAKAHAKASKHSNARAHNLVKKARAHTAKARALYRRQLWNAAKHAAKKAGAHKKVAKVHAKKARKHFHIAKKL